MPKKITIAAIVIALMGLYVELALTSVWDGSVLNYYLRSFFTSIRLGFIDGNRFYEPDRYNYIHLFYYSLLLTGGILNLISRKEVRLLRYVFSVILLCKFLDLFFMVVTLPFNADWVFLGYNWLIWLGYLAWHALWIWMCWAILRYYRNTKEIAIMKKQYGELEQDFIVEASRWQRLWHLIVDSLTFLFVLFPILEWLIRIDAVREFLQPLENSLGERLALYFICAIFQILFYMFFEGLLQATPGKLLSETRVVNDTGGKPAVSNLLLRTVVRFVPFESLSVLFARGWHDDWSDTYVVREKREGVNGGWYFFIFPAFLFIGLFGYLGIESYKKHQAEQRDKERFEEKQERIEETLDKLTTDHVVTISKGYGGQVFMKAENIDKDKITFVYIYGQDMYSSGNTQQEMEYYFLEETDELERVTLTRKELAEGILKEYDPKVSNEFSHKGIADLLKDGNRYYIIDIAQWFAPNIAIDNSYISSSDGSAISINLKNFGWSAELVKIENKGDEIDWGGMPVMLRNDSEYTNNTQITGTGKDIEEIDADLFVKDTLGRVQVYNIKGEADEIGNLEMKRIK
ncbi:RDD family protein [Flavobacterium sp. MFBS3-15]|uniref:RDD family protein n=1 Tax=Flavobacterium sp. MFBS3-15 TaxID=2989816 RepID=UPI0022367AA5|nr:RDD family protein [Flavobacterium sp. MFBS3-15]MCW4468309.1 RDD family protein [Flavobacterium sp. MFBS3-15]